MEGFVLEFKEIKDSIAVLKSENTNLKDTVAEMKKDMNEIKEENVTLREQVTVLQDMNMKSSSPSCTPSASDNTTGVDSVDHKIKKMYHKFRKVERSVMTLKDETNRNATEIQEESSRSRQLQRVFNNLHVSLQSRKDLQDNSSAAAISTSTTTKDIQTSQNAEPATSPSRLKQHPSKRGLSGNVLSKALDFKKRSLFSATLDALSFLYNTVTCVEGYTKMETPSDFMDPELGVFTIPVKGNYKFCVSFSINPNKIYLYLCTNRDEKHMDVALNVSSSNDVYFKEIVWECEADDLVWLEVKGAETQAPTSTIIFQGMLL